MAAPRLTHVPEQIPGSLQIVTLEQGTTSTIELEGEWDLAQCDATREVVAQALQRRPECLVFDLSRLSFIDSSGIHALIETHERCAAQETRLVVIPGPRAVQRVFAICGLTTILPFARDASPVSSDIPSAPGELGVPSLRPDGAAGPSLRRPTAPAPGPSKAN